MVIDSSEEICNEYAAQTMFYQNQAFPTEKSQILSGFYLFPKNSQRCWKKPQFQNPASKKPNSQPCLVALALNLPVSSQFGSD